MTDDYVAYWGEKNLTKWRSTVLADVDIPQASKLFLENAGMPPFQSGWSPWRWEPSLPFAEDGRRILGKQYDTPLLLSSGGSVVRERLPPHPGGLPGCEEMWFNSSVEQFAHFITEFHKFYRSEVYRSAADLYWPDRGADTKLQQAVDDLWDGLMRVDPSGEQGYWKFLIVEARTGLSD